MIDGFKCKQCGVCCKYLDNVICITAEKEDVARWETNSETDILKRLLPIYIGNDQYIHDIWFHPVTREAYSYCPWLRREKGNKYKYHCKMHHSKAHHCRNYPITRKQALFLACPGVKPKNYEEKKLRSAGFVHFPIKKMIYKDFFAKINYNVDIGIFEGKVFYINNVNLEQYKYNDENIITTFRAKGPEHWEREFHISVNSYLKKK